MPNYTVSDPVSGKTVTLTGDSPPTENELNEIFYSLGSSGTEMAGEGQRNTTNIRKESIESRLSRAVKETVMAPLAPWLSLSRDKVEKDLGMRAIEPTLGKVGLSQLAQEIGDSGRRFGLNASKRVGEMIAESPVANVSPTLAATLGATASTIGDIAANGAILSPKDAQIAAGQEAMNIYGKIALGALKPTAVSSARKALGFTKKHLNSTKSWSESLRKQAQANRAAEMMLDKNGISWIGSPETSANNAIKIMRESAAEMDNILTSIDNTGVRLTPNEVASDLIDNLKPRFKDEQKVVEEILSDVQNFPDGISLNEAKTILKKRWGKLGYDKTVGTIASNLYRKASEVIEKSISSKVKEVGGDVLSKSYGEASKTWGNAVTALRPVGEKMSGEMGNSLVDLPTNVVAAGQLVSGNFPAAMATAGVYQSLRRRGMAPLARSLNALSRGARPVVATSGALGLRSLAHDNLGDTNNGNFVDSLPRKRSGRWRSPMAALIDAAMMGNQ